MSVKHLRLTLQSFRHVVALVYSFLLQLQRNDCSATVCFDSSPLVTSTPSRSPVEPALPGRCIRFPSTTTVTPVSIAYLLNSSHDLTRTGSLVMPCEHTGAGWTMSVTNITTRAGATRLILFFFISPPAR